MGQKLRFARRPEECMAAKRNGSTTRRPAARKQTTHRTGRPTSGPVSQYRSLQREAERRASRTEKSTKAKEAPVQAGARRQPGTPLPRQHQAKPGLESEVRPAPRYLAPEYRGSDKLRDRVAIITGGDSGIGRAVAVLFAREGADVAIAHLPEEQRDAEETKQAIENEGQKALLIPGDVSRPEFCREAVARTVKVLGGLDILVNNAAYQQNQDSLEAI